MINIKIELSMNNFQGEIVNIFLIFINSIISILFYQLLINILIKIYKVLTLWLLLWFIISSKLTAYWYILFSKKLFFLLS